jgi:hypothetical protein
MFLKRKLIREMGNNWNFLSINNFLVISELSYLKFKVIKKKLIFSSKIIELDVFGGYVKWPKTIWPTICDRYDRFYSLLADGYRINNCDRSKQQLKFIKLS